MADELPIKVKVTVDKAGSEKELEATAQAVTSVGAAAEKASRQVQAASKAELDQQMAVFQGVDKASVEAHNRQMKRWLEELNLEREIRLARQRGFSEAEIQGKTADQLEQQRIERLRQEIAAREEAKQKAVQDAEDQKRALEEVEELKRRAAEQEERRAKFMSQPVTGGHQPILGGEILENLGPAADKLTQARVKLNDDINRLFALAVTDPESRERIQKGMSSLTDEMLKADPAVKVTAGDIQRQLVPALKAAGFNAEQIASILGSKTVPQVRNLGQALEKLRSASYRLTAIGAGLTAIGGAIFYGAQRLADNFVQTMNAAGVKGNAIVDKWNAVQKRFKNDSLELGQLFAEKMLPIMEKAADFLDKVVKFAQENPKIIEGIVNIGGAVAAAGAIVTAFGGIARVLGSLAELPGMLGLGGAAAGAATGGGTATAAGIGGALTAAAPAIGVLIGGAIVAEFERRGLNKVLGTNQSFGDVATTGKRAIALLDFGAAMLKMGDASAEAKAKLWEEIKAHYGLSEAADKAAQKTSELSNSVVNAQANQILANLNDTVLTINRKYALERLQIEAELSARLKAIATNTASALAAAYSQYQSQLASIQKNFTEQEAKAAEDYARQQAEIEKSLQEDIARIRKDAAKALQQLEEDHNARLYDLASARDALGIVQENRAYAREKERITEGAAEQIKERKKQAAEQLKDLRENYERARAERLKQYQEQLAEAAKQYEERKAQILQQAEEERKQAQEAAKQKLAELKEQQYEEIRQAVLAANDKIKQLGTRLQAELDLQRIYHGYMLSDAEDFVRKYQQVLQGLGGTPPPGTPPPGTPGYPDRGTGGYAQEGIYHLGEGGKDEFVLSAATTRAAEQLLGGQLTQSKLIQALLGGRGRGEMTWNDHRRFDSRITPEERREIQRDNERTLERMFA